eukprot:scaffold61205_cov40-Prasinocladus_malaysianus.AAC.2
MAPAMLAARNSATLRGSCLRQQAPRLQARAAPSSRRVVAMAVRSQRTSRPPQTCPRDKKQGLEAYACSCGQPHRRSCVSPL